MHASQIQDFNFDNILINGKSYKKNLIYNFSYKTPKRLHVTSDDVNGFIRAQDGITYLILFSPEIMTLFVIKLDILLVRKVAFHILFCKNKN